MESAKDATSIGYALERCIVDARRDWLKSNQGGRDEESAWTLDVVETTLCVEFKHGGRADASVTVIAKDPWKCVTTFYKLRRYAPGDWRRLVDSLNLDAR